MNASLVKNFNSEKMLSADLECQVQLTLIVHLRSPIICRVLNLYVPIGLSLIILMGLLVT